MAETQKVPVEAELFSLDDDKHEVRVNGILAVAKPNQLRIEVNGVDLMKTMVIRSVRVVQETR